MTKITKDIIIETAYQLFFKHGYNNVTINDICKECKITKPTFYTYIKSKDDILAHFYDDITEAIVANTANIIMAENYWQQLLICFETLMEESIQYQSPESSGQPVLPQNCSPMRKLLLQ